jgi:hypothetical protein
VYVEDYSDHFKIDANNGEIRTATILSFDYRPTYRMTVIASDQGVPPLQGQAIINIQVILSPKMWKNILNVSFDSFLRGAVWDLNSGRYIS